MSVSGCLSDNFPSRETMTTVPTERCSILYSRILIPSDTNCEPGAEVLLVVSSEDERSSGPFEFHCMLAPCSATLGLCNMGRGMDTEFCPSSRLWDGCSFEKKKKKKEEEEEEPVFACRASLFFLALMVSREFRGRYAPGPAVGCSKLPCLAPVAAGSSGSRTLAVTSSHTCT